MNWSEISSQCVVDSPPDSPHRRFERHSCRIVVRYRRLQAVNLFHEQDTYLEGMVRNQSKGGVLIEATEFLPEGQQVEMSFSSPDGRTSYLATGVVRWLKKLGFRNYHVGVEFEDVSTF